MLYITWVKILIKLFKLKLKIGKKILLKLVRAILDVHPDISCGPETKILPSFLSYLRNYLVNEAVQRDLTEGGVQMRTVERAASAFIYYILNFRGASADDISSAYSSFNEKTTTRPCAKDPDILHHIAYLHQIFPNAKFVHMIRDGRAAAHSFMLRVKEELTFDRFLSYFSSWNSYVQHVDAECSRLGPDVCIQIRYEDLVSRAEPVMRRVLRFLNATWTDELLRHEAHFTDEISVSRLEWSTSQIQNRIYNNSLRPLWAEKIPSYNGLLVESQMLRRFGYNLSLGMRPVAEAMYRRSISWRDRSRVFL